MTGLTTYFLWFPHGLEILEKWENIFQSGNFEQTGKVEKFYPQCWKSEGILGSFYFFFDFLI